MTNNPRISIITPTYNHEKFIAQCLESVLAQSYPDWEQIVIDDGSDDRTEDIASQYNDERIKYIRQKNKGIWKLSETYNRALQLAKGEYIAILEGDDFWPADKLELQIKAMDCSDSILSWGKAQIVDVRGENLSILPKSIKKFMCMSSRKFLSVLLLYNPMHSCTVVCKKSALLSIGGFKQTKDAPYVDGPTWLELSLIGDFLPIDEVLGCYRRHDRQISSSMKASMIKAGLYSIEFFNDLPYEVKASLEKTVGDLAEKLKRKEIDSYYYLGRAYLSEDNRSLAKQNFSEAICKGDYAIRAKAILGLICCYCGIDLERLAEFYDRRNPKDR
jgi:glycosyltransferase involved in cell wall biosynthesis